MKEESYEEKCNKRYLEEKGYIQPVLVGRGAFSKVYRVREKNTGEFYACKISSQIPMLLREAEILREIRHPLFPQYKDILQENKTGYLVTEYVSGSNLAGAVRKRGGFSERQTMRIGIELAEGLTFLEELRKPILYRDLKPNNLKIKEDGRIKLLDFGCACYANNTRKTIVGTPGFAAPEQLAEGLSSPAGDVYAFGRLLQYLLSGELPSGKLQKGRLKISKELFLFLEKCTEQDVERRFPDMRICLYLLSDIFDRKKEKKFCFYEKNIWKRA